MLAPVRWLGGYELIAPLARGGMAEVYLARRRVGGVEKRLVIKRLRRERVGDARMLDLFIREAQLSMALVQQNIVPVFDFGRVGDDVFLAMEFIDGADLATALAGAPDARMAPAIAAHVGAECCQALAYAHRAGVVHRDVSARNVLVSRDGEVKLADFGLAVVQGDAAVVGTPRYLAPEQARGEPVDGRADLYALGMVLVEAVAGAPARPGASLAEVLANARSGARAPLPLDLPPALAAILERATAAAPAARFANAQAMWEALDTYLLAARAGGGEAPRRQLASWLEQRRLPAPPTEGEGAAWPTTDACSFLDDGEAAVRGLATQRSLARTIDQPAHLPPDPARPQPSPAPPDAAPAAPTPTTDRAGRAATQRPGWAWLVRTAVLLGALGLAGLGWRAFRSASVPPGARPLVIAAPPDARATDARLALAPITDAGRPRAVPVDDAARAPVDPRPVDALAGARHRPAHVATATRDARPAPPAATVDASTALAPPITRWATLGARPWAMVSIDGGASEESPVRIRLTVGPHRVRFVNPELDVTREIVIDVPATGELRHVEVLTALAAPP